MPAIPTLCHCRLLTSPAFPSSSSYHLTKILPKHLWNNFVPTCCSVEDALPSKITTNKGTSTQKRPPMRKN